MRKFLIGITAVLALALVSTISSNVTSVHAGGDCDTTSLCGEVVAQPVLTSKGKIPKAVHVDASHGAWTIMESEYIGTDPIVAQWLDRLADPNPSNWETFPNIPNPKDPSFRVVPCKDLNPDVTDSTKLCVPDGLEYGEDESPFGENNPLDIVIPAGHYRGITGDRSVLSGTCQLANRIGCAFIGINVGGETVTLRGQSVDNGWTVSGRYWNGDKLEIGLNGLVSHISANMLGMRTYAHPGEVLNSGNISHPDDAGANCSTLNACNAVDVTVIVFAGNRVLAVMHTIVVSSELPRPATVVTHPRYGDELAY